jgi:type IV pilus assembly protein PilE
MKAKTRGFTLIEIMITLVIVAILAAIAVPSYRAFVLRSNRIDATGALLALAAAQEKFFLQNNTYALNAQLATAQPNGLGITGTEHGWYTLAIAAPTVACPITECWAATATPVSTEQQAEDTDCTSFAINSLGQRTAKKGGSDNTANCWKK